MKREKMKFSKGYIWEMIIFFIISIAGVIAVNTIDVERHYKELVLLFSGVNLGLGLAMFIILDLVRRKKVVITEVKTP